MHRENLCGCGANHGPTVWLRRADGACAHIGIRPAALLSEYTFHAEPNIFHPLWRRVFRPSRAKPLTSIQPMSLPRQTFFLDQEGGRARGGQSVGQDTGEQT